MIVFKTYFNLITTPAPVDRSYMVFEKLSNLMKQHEQFQNVMIGHRPNSFEIELIYFRAILTDKNITLNQT